MMFRYSSDNLEQEKVKCVGFVETEMRFRNSIKGLRRRCIRLPCCSPCSLVLVPLP